MASLVTDEGAYQLATGGLVFTTGTWKVRLVASSATPDKTITAMTGLTSIGTDQALANKTTTKDGTNHRVVFDADDPVWTAVASGTVGWAIVYKDGANDAARVPVFVEAVGPVVANGSDLTWQINAAGINYIQQ